MFTKIALVYCYKCDSSESLCVVTAAPAGTCVHIAVSPQTVITCCLVRYATFSSLFLLILQPNFPIKRFLIEKKTCLLHFN